jgi:hypothetical protein
MGQLDKFSGKGTNRSTSLTKGGLQPPPWVRNTNRECSKSAEQILQGASGRFAIALDATGSMAMLINMAKRSIGEILTRVIREASRPVDVMLVAYRDYDVPNDIVSVSAPTKDHNRLISWLDGIQPLGGGSNDGEAVERTLEKISQSGRFDAVLLAGDEPPNNRTFLNTINRLDTPVAEDLARRFAQTKTPIHTFVVGNDPRTINEFAKIASLSGGKPGRLDGSAEMIDVAAMAMLTALKGVEGVKAYMKDYQITSRGEEFARLLIAAPKNES